LLQRPDHLLPLLWGWVATAAVWLPDLLLLLMVNACRHLSAAACVAAAA
jgi:hypothetical protein